MTFDKNSLVSINVRYLALEVYIMRELLCLPQSLSLSLSLCLSDLYNIHEQIKNVTIVLSAGRYAVESR